MLYEPLNQRTDVTAREAQPWQDPSNEALNRLRKLNGGFGRTPGINPMLPHTSPSSPQMPSMPQYSQQQQMPNPGSLPWGNMFGAFGYNSFFSGGRR